MPDSEERKEVLEIHTRNMPLADDVNLDKIANTTHGCVGADLESLCKEAAMRVVRRILPEIQNEVIYIIPKRLYVVYDVPNIHFQFFQYISLIR